MRNRRLNNYQAPLNTIYSSYTEVIQVGYLPHMDENDVIFCDPFAYIAGASNRYWRGINDGEPMQERWDYSVVIATFIYNETFEENYENPFTTGGITDMNDVYQYRSIDSWNELYDESTGVYQDSSRYEIIGYVVIGNSVFFQHNKIVITLYGVVHSGVWQKASPHLVELRIFLK